jgi:uncharacterized cupredoxin-like copper-binding protein
MSVKSVLAWATVLVVAAMVAEAAAQAPHRLKLGLSEYRISPATASAGHGHVTIRVTNAGNETHELLVVKGRRSLPTRNGRVDEEALEEDGRVIGEIADVKRGKTAGRTFTLKKGSYVLLCNLPGHYKSGMHATLVVR